MKDVFATSAKIFIVLEFVGGGELFDKIANEGMLDWDLSIYSIFTILVNYCLYCIDSIYTIKYYAIVSNFYNE